MSDLDGRVRARFVGRTAVVVGGASGIGRATVELLAAEGATTIVIDDDGKDTEGVCAAVRALGGTTLGMTVPFGEPDAVLGVASRLDGIGSVEVLVNCQMATEAVSIEASSLEQWERALRVNLTGAWAATKAFLPSLKRADHAAIVNVTSVDGIFGNPRVPSYSVSKGGLVPLTHTAAHEFAPYGIRVNAVARVGITTEPSLSGEAYRRRLLEATPMGRLGHPSETAAAIAFLASDDASYVNGTVLVVDGGRTGLTAGTHWRD